MKWLTQLRIHGSGGCQKVTTVRRSDRVVGARRGIKQKGADEVGGTDDAVRGAGWVGKRQEEGIMKGKRNDHTQDYFVNDLRPRKRKGVGEHVRGALRGFSWVAEGCLLPKGQRERGAWGRKGGGGHI